MAVEPHRRRHRFFLSAVALVVGASLASTARADAPAPTPPTTPGLLTAWPQPAGDCELLEGDAYSWCSFFHLDTRLISGERQRALLKFDVAGAVPAGVKVVSTRLALNAQKTYGFWPEITIHRVNRPWDSSATWVQATEATSWSTPGADFETTPSAAARVQQGWNHWDIASLTQAWVDGVSPNNGVLVKTAEQTEQGAYFASDDDIRTGSDSVHPSLYVVYSYDRTPPPAPTSLNATSAQGSTTVSWQQRGDPPLADGSPGTGVGRWEYRYKRGTETFGAWQSTLSNSFAFSSGAGNESVDVEVRAFDRAENASPVAATSVTGGTYSTSSAYGGSDRTVNTDDEAAALGKALGTRADFQGLWDELDGYSKDYMLAGDDPEYEAWTPRIDKRAPSAPTGISPSAFDPTAGRVEITWDDGDDPDLPSGRPATQSDEYHSAYRYQRNGGWSTWKDTDEAGFILESTKANDKIQVEARSYDRAGNPGAIANKTVTIKAPPTTAGNTPKAGAPVAVACVIFCPEAVVAAGIGVGATAVGVYVINGVRVDVQKKANQEAIEIRQAAKDLAEAEKTWNEEQVRNRRKLRKDAGDKVAQNEEAHHIIAVKAKAAAPARRIAFKCGMDLNNFDQNGVDMNRNLHRKTHTEAYYQAINRLMERFNPDDALNQDRCLPGDPFADNSVRRALKAIAEKIRRGDFVG